MARPLAVSEGAGAAGAGRRAGGAPALTRGRFRAGTAEAGPGERAFGHLSALLPDGQEARVACSVLHGGRPGPVLYVHSTQHGNEISGSRWCAGWPRRSTRAACGAPWWPCPSPTPWPSAGGPPLPAGAGGGLPGPPGAGPGPGLARRPGGVGARAIGPRPVGRRRRHASHVIDLHTWNRWQAAATTVDAWHAPSLDLALAFGLWVQARRQPAPPEEGASRSLPRVAIEQGKAACAPNLTGQWDIYEPEVRRGVAGLRQVLRHLGCGPSPAARRPHRGAVVFATDDLVDVRVPDEGIFLPRTRPEQRVARGAVLGDRCAWRTSAPSQCGPRWTPWCTW